MYIKILLGYILGYINIEVEGYFIERFINLCKNNKVLLWNSKRKKNTLLYTNIGINDFKKIAKDIKQTKCKVKIKNKKGLPFIFNKYKKRKIFFIFLLIIVTGIIALSNLIWNIEIIGNTRISNEELLNSLKDEGLKIGTWKTKINTQEIVNKIRLVRSDLAWIGIEIKGTNAVVKVVEADKKPDIINEEEYCNIVATKPGIIVKVDALNGTPLVKEGDVIKKGTVLIGGWLEGKYTGTNYVHANGEVKAKVWYEEIKKIKLKETEIKKNGNFETKYSVKINNFNINFYKTLSKFKNYDTIEENKKLKIFSDFYLPVEVVKKVNYELVQEEKEYTAQEAKNKAVEDAKKELNKKIQNEENIINTYINYKETEGTIEAQVIYEVLEEIGTKEKIVF